MPDLAGMVKPMRRKRRSVEDPIQAAVMRYLRAVLPGCKVHHSPNGAHHDARQGAKLLHMGVLPGFPDVFLFGRDARGQFLLGFMEVKAPKKYPEPEQRVFRDFCRDLGAEFPIVHWALVRSIDDARAALAEWGVATREIRGVDLFSNPSFTVEVS